MIAHGTSFIKFDLHPETMLTSPPNLYIYVRIIFIHLLKNSKFWNFNYEWNSFIEFNEYGGTLYIEDGEFDTFSSCGSFIRNKRYTDF